MHNLNVELVILVLYGSFQESTYVGKWSYLSKLSVPLKGSKQTETNIAAKIDKSRL